jgi:lysozyme
MIAGNTGPTIGAPAVSKRRIAAAALAAMLAVATPLVAGWEGYSSKPYADKLAGGLLTVCFGETRVPMRTYTRAECEAMLSDGVGEFAVGVAKRNPELVGHPNAWAAASSLAYNIGLANYSRSTVAKRFSAGRWREACERFTDWRFAGGREVRGLLNRRRAERALCLKDLPA